MHMKPNFYVVAALSLLVLAARAQTTAFTYQGQLNRSNTPANGIYDFRFQLFDAGSNVVSAPLTNSSVGVTNGSFIVTLNFGATIFDGSDRWLQIAVRAFGDVNAYTALSPLQQITSTPYAIRAINATSASNAVFLTAPLQGTNIIGTIRATNLPLNVAFLDSNQVFTASNTFNGVVTANNSANVFSGAFTGNAGGLINVPATSLTGTIPDARLSANVALQSNPNLNFAGAVSATNFTGAGHGLTNVPGAFFWVVVSGASVQAQPNVGYICNNDVVPVTITLPSVPVVGDVYKVAAVGAGGWIIAQNANQMIAAGNLSGTVGQNWKVVPSAGLNWSTIASSADGTKLVAAINGGLIYTSTNSGATWAAHNSSPLSASLSWSSVACSSDGTKLVATVGYTIYATAPTGVIYTSPDSGATWVQNNSGSKSWSSVASSADGNRLVAAVNNGQLYVSNSVVNWGAQSSPSAFWTSVASSANGSNLVAVASGGQIDTSTNLGVSWVPRITGSTNWTAVASSADGSRLIAGASTGQIILSTDSGVTWVPLSSPASGQITSIASSSDGSRLAVTFGGNSTATTGNIYISSDSGATWTRAAGAPTVSWADIASSADGSQFAAAVYGGNIYVSSQSSTTTGAAGYLTGSQHSAIELIYTGNNLFLPLSHEGTIRAY